MVLKREQAKACRKTVRGILAIFRKKGYHFEDGFEVKIHDENFVMYNPKSEKYEVKVSDWGNLLHELNHVVLEFDGIGGDIGYSEDPSSGDKTILDVQNNGKFSSKFIDILLRPFLGNFVLDYYVNSLLLNFSGGFATENLKNGLNDYFNWMRAVEKHTRGFVNEFIEKEYNLQETIFSAELCAFSWFFNPKVSAFKSDFDFNKFLENFSSLENLPPNFFNKRVGAIKNLVDSMPSYGTLKGECGRFGCPRLTARLSVRIFNLFYYGVDMEHKEDISKFTTLIREDKTSKLFEDYGVTIEKNQRDVAKELVNKMTGGYDKFIKECTMEGPKFSLLLV